MVTSLATTVYVGGLEPSTASEVLAAAFGSERSSRRIRDLAMKRKLLYEKVTTVIGGGLTAKAVRETATLTGASWSPQLHPLCAPSQRRAVRAVLMLHNRGADESLWGKLPADLVVEVCSNGYRSSPSRTTRACAGCRQ